MNCKSIQRRLLGAESPDRPDADCQAHLDGCAACREWQGRLLQIEHAIPRLPIAASATRDAFLLDLVLPDNVPEESAPAPAPLPAPMTRSAPPPPLVRLPLLTSARRPTATPRVAELAWRWRHAAAGAAAALLLVAVASWSLQKTRQPVPVAVTPPRPTPDPLVANLMQRNLSLATAQKPDDRVDALTHMAEDLGRESQALTQAGNAEDLAQYLTQLRLQVTDSLQKLTAKADAANAVADASPAPDARRVQQLHRNRGLIQTLVEGAIRLATEDDPLRRADSCSDLAHSLAAEIRQAAQGRDSDRAMEMGQHLNDLFRGGVATNLRVVRRNTHKNSLAEMQMFKVRDWVEEVAAPLEYQLRLASDTDRDTMNKAIETIRVGRREVENAVRG